MAGAISSRIAFPRQTHLTQWQKVVKQAGDARRQRRRFLRGHRDLRGISSGPNTSSLLDYEGQGGVGESTTSWLSRFQRRSSPSDKRGCNPPCSRELRNDTPRLPTNRQPPSATPEPAISSLAECTGANPGIKGDTARSGRLCGSQQRDQQLLASHRSRVHLAHLRPS